MAKFQLKKFEPDPQLAIDGRWMEYAAGFRVKVAYWGNPKFEEYVIALTKPHQRQIALDSLDDETNRKIMAKAISRHILLSWEGLADDEDETKDVPYTREKAEELLAANREFMKTIISMAKDFKAFRAQQEGQDAGN